MTALAQAFPGAATAALCSAIAAVVAFVISVVTFWLKTREYFRSITLKRFEKYYAISRAFDEDATVQEVIRALEEGDEKKLAGLDRSKKVTFICFIEDVVIMRNSGLLTSDLAAYTFGYYARLCYQRDAFWTDLKRSDPFFKAFTSFAGEVMDDRIASLDPRTIRV
jgi:hypothetical protein